ncbi:MAG: hypothetical protein ACPGYV_05285 [Phycisphaeraceae bacterium]
MSVTTHPFRVVGVNTQTGKDVSIVIDAATKAAAEVKAEQLHIETTHIVRIKEETPVPPDEHELFSTEAAEALAGKPTASLIEEVTAHEPHEPEPTAHKPTPIRPEPAAVVAAIARPTYAAPANSRDKPADAVSGLRAFGLVLVVLLGISAGAYFVLVHQPNALNAQEPELVFGQDLFSDVITPKTSNNNPAPLRDAFEDLTNRNTPAQKRPPIAEEQQRIINDRADAPKPTDARLALDSVVTTNTGRFAVINGKLYKEGADLGSAKLVSVANDWVLIERDGKQITLNMQDTD